MIRIARIILCWALVVPAIGHWPSRAGDDPARPTASARDDAPVYIFLDPASDVDAVRKKLNRPDFVLMKGTLYEALQAQSKPIVPPKRGVIESVSVGGEILDDLAHLTIDFGISLAGVEPAWVPIRLDGQIVTFAREGERDLPVRSIEGVWQVRIEGEGQHRIQIGLSSVVLSAKGGAAGRRLEWSIPEAASTRVNVSLAANTRDIVAVSASGIREALVVEQAEGGQRNRVSAFLTPRRTLELQWNVAADSGAAGPAIVTAQGEIALDVERGSIRARSSWEVRSERGTTQRLELRIDPADELVGLECDGRPVASDESRDANSGIISVPLANPLAPGESCRLVITTRRALSPETSTRLTYRGVPLVNVVAQSGVLAISQSGGDPWVTASPGRGLRAIDPRSELPATLRTRPSIVLAYQFVEQPFDLGIQVDPSPPEIRVESRTTVALDSKTSRVDAWLDYTVARGRVFEVRVDLPEGMTLDSAGPDSVVSSFRTLASSAGERPVLVARLTSRATEDGRFSLRIQGRQTLAQKSLASIGLPRPVEARSRGGLLAVLSDRNVAVELAPGKSASASAFASAAVEVPASWPWPSWVEGSVIPPALWLRSDESPASLQLAISARKRDVHEETTLTAIVGRRNVDVRQESVLRVLFGTISSVEVSVPPQIEGLWEVEGLEVARRESLGVGPDRSNRYRLTLARPVVDRERLRFHIRSPWKEPLQADQVRAWAVPRVHIENVQSSNSRVRVGGEDGVDVAGRGEGWLPVEDDAANTSLVRIESTTQGVAIVDITAHSFAVLPKLVASRLSLVSTQQRDGGLRTAATYRLESHGESLVVSLPLGAEWIRAKVAQDTVTEVERVSTATGAYRLKLPPESVEALLVTLEFSQPAKELARSGGWAAPNLSEDAIVQEASWEIRVPSHLSLVGVPSGWTDENRWVWNRYAFARRPATATDETLDAKGIRAYRFGCVGEPPQMNPWLIPSAGLVGLCSGMVLAIGLLILSLRGSSQVVAYALSAAVLLAIVLIPPSAVPQFLQSSALGFLLLLVSGATRRVLENRRPQSRLAVESSGLIGSDVMGSGQSSASDVPPDGSTVIRARVGTTVERAPVESPETAPAGIVG